MSKDTHPDASVIERLGGPTKVAEMLGLDKRRGGVQRVQNWITRGIPPAVKLEHQGIFLHEVHAPRPNALTPSGHAEPKAA
jgi:hypothetical protein